MTLAAVAPPVIQTAVQLLLRQLDGEEIGGEHRVFPIGLRKRHTTARRNQFEEACPPKVSTYDTH